MNKKIIAALLAIAMVFSFTACGEKAGDNTGDAAEAAKKFKTVAEHINYANFEGFDIEKGIGIDFKLGLKGGLKDYLEKQLTDENQKKYIPFIDALSKETQLSYNFAYKMADDKTPMLAIYYGLINNGKALLDLKGQSDQENMSFSFPALSEKGFYITLAKLTEVFGEEEDQQQMANFFKLNFKKYIDIVKGDKTGLEFYSTELAKYKEIADKYINDNATKTETTSIERDGKTISVTEYKVNYDYAQNMAVLKEYLTVARDDEALLDLIISKSTALLDEFIKSKDYELFDMTEEEINDYKARFDKYVGEDKPQLIEKWKKAIDEILASYESEDYKQAVEMLKDVDINYLVRINGENQFDSMLMNFAYKYEADKKLEMFADMVYNFNPEFEAVDKDKFFSLDGMLTKDSQKMQEYAQKNPELAEYIKAFLGDVATYVSESENVKHINELMKANGLEQEEAMFNMMTQQMKSMLENMTVDQIMGMFAQ